MEKRQNQVSEKEAQQTISRKSIPIDLFISIFSRLPVKAIARFRCVSKQWGSIFRRRDFTDLFVRMSLTRLCLLFTFNFNGTWHFFSAPQHQKSSLLAPDRHMTFPSRVDVYRMSRPVCGLLSGIPRNPFICNPSTGQYIHLPNETSMVTNYFGYDPIDKLFKVLSIHDDYQVRVLTLGTAELSWRGINCSIPHIALADGICMSGTLYYLAFNKYTRTPNQAMLVCFDLKLETFKFMHVGISTYSALLNFNGKLGVVLPDGGSSNASYGKLTSGLVVWVLDDVEKKSWSKHIYQLPSSWENLVGNNMLYVVGMSGTDEIVFSPNYVSGPFYIFYYNVVKNTIVRVEIQLGIELPKGLHIHTFMDHVQDVKLMEELGS